MVARLDKKVAKKDKTLIQAEQIAHAQVSLAIKPVHSLDAKFSLTGKYEEVTGYALAAGVSVAALGAFGLAVRSVYRKATDFSKGKAEQATECLL